MKNKGSPVTAQEYCRQSFQAMLEGGEPTQGSAVSQSRGNRILESGKVRELKSAGQIMDRREWHTKLYPMSRDLWTSLSSFQMATDQHVCVKKLLRGTLSNVQAHTGLGVAPFSTSQNGKTSKFVWQQVENPEKFCLPLLGKKKALD